MNRLYNTTSPVFLLLAGWVFLGIAMGIRILSGQNVPAFNILFLVVSLAVYFLPPYLSELNKGVRLRRKLLWLLVLAGFVVLAGELAKVIIGHANT